MRSVIRGILALLPCPAVPEAEAASSAPHTAPAASATVVIQGGKRGPSFSALREVVAYRGVFFALVRRGITTRFRQSMGGILWLLAGPLSSAIIYTVFVGR